MAQLNSDQKKKLFKSLDRFPKKAIYNTILRSFLDKAMDFLKEKQESEINSIPSQRENSSDSGIDLSVDENDSSLNSSLNNSKDTRVNIKGSLIEYGEKLDKAQITLKDMTKIQGSSFLNDEEKEKVIDIIQLVSGSIDVEKIVENGIENKIDEWNERKESSRLQLVEIKKDQAKNLNIPYDLELKKNQFKSDRIQAEIDQLNRIKEETVPTLKGKSQFERLADITQIVAERGTAEYRIIANVEQQPEVDVGIVENYQDRIKAINKFIQESIVPHHSALPEKVKAEQTLKNQLKANGIASIKQNVSNMQYELEKKTLEISEPDIKFNINQLEQNCLDVESKILLARLNDLYSQSEALLKSDIFLDASVRPPKGTGLEKVSQETRMRDISDTQDRIRALENEAKALCSDDKYQRWSQNPNSLQNDVNVIVEGIDKIQAQYAQFNAQSLKQRLENSRTTLDELQKKTQQILKPLVEEFAETHLLANNEEALKNLLKELETNLSADDNKEFIRQKEEIKNLFENNNDDFVRQKEEIKNLFKKYNHDLTDQAEKIEDLIDNSAHLTSEKCEVVENRLDELNDQYNTLHTALDKIANEQKQKETAAQDLLERDSANAAGKSINAITEKLSGLYNEIGSELARLEICREEAEDLRGKKTTNPFLEIDVSKEDLILKNLDGARTALTQARDQALSARLAYIRSDDTIQANVAIDTIKDVINNSSTIINQCEGQLKILEQDFSAPTPDATDGERERPVSTASTSTQAIGNVLKQSSSSANLASQSTPADEEPLLPFDKLESQFKAMKNESNEKSSSLFLLQLKAQIAASDPTNAKSTLWLAHLTLPELKRHVNGLAQIVETDKDPSDEYKNFKEKFAQLRNKVNASSELSESQLKECRDEWRLQLHEQMQKNYNEFSGLQSKQHAFESSLQASTTSSEDQSEGLKKLNEDWKALNTTSEQFKKLRSTFALNIDVLAPHQLVEQVRRDAVIQLHAVNKEMLGFIDSAYDAEEKKACQQAIQARFEKTKILLGHFVKDKLMFGVVTGLGGFLDEIAAYQALLKDLPQDAQEKVQIGKMISTLEHGVGALSILFEKVPHHADTWHVKSIPEGQTYDSYVKKEAQAALERQDQDTLLVLRSQNYLERDQLKLGQVTISEYGNATVVSGAMKGEKQDHLVFKSTLIKKPEKFNHFETVFKMIDEKGKSISISLPDPDLLLVCVKMLQDHQHECRATKSSEAPIYINGGTQADVVAMYMAAELLGIPATKLSNQTAHAVSIEKKTGMINHLFTRGEEVKQRDGFNAEQKQWINAYFNDMEKTQSAAHAIPEDGLVSIIRSYRKENELRNQSAEDICKTMQETAIKIDTPWLPTNVEKEIKRIADERDLSRPSPPG